LRQNISSDILRYISASWFQLKPIISKISFWSGNSSLKNKNSFIYSPSSCSKPVWVSYFYWAQKTIILKNVGNQTVDGNVSHFLVNGYCQLTKMFGWTFPLKHVVHFEIIFWYVLAYLKGIQDVGVFISTVFSILTFFDQTVLVCQSYNGDIWGSPQRACTEKSKLNMI